LAFDAFALSKFHFFTPGKIVKGLSMTAALLNILFVFTAFLLEMIIKNGRTSIVPIELGRTGILWILWLADFAYWYSFGPVVASDCASLTDYPIFQADCAFEIFGPIFAIFNFIILFAWFVTVLIFSIKGNHWKSPVHKFDLTKKRADILEAQARQPTTSYFSGKTPVHGGHYPPQQGYYPQSPPQQTFSPGPQQEGYWVPAQQMNHQPPQGYWAFPLTGAAPPGTPQAGGPQAPGWPQQSPPQQPAQEAQSPPVPPSTQGAEQGAHNSKGAVAQ